MGNPDPNKNDVATSRAGSTVAKYDGDWNGDEIDAGLAGEPYEVISHQENGDTPNEE